MWPAIKDFVQKLLKSSASTIVLALCLAIAGYFLLRAPSPPSYTSEPGAVTTAVEPKVVTKVVEKIKRVMVPGPSKIIYLDKEKLSAALKMPELMKEEGVPVDTASIPAHTGPTTTVTLLNPETGVFKAVTRQEPPKFLQFKKEWGVRAGFGTGNLVLGEIYLRPLRLGPIDLEVRGYARRTDRDGSDFGGVLLLDYRF